MRLKKSAEFYKGVKLFSTNKYLEIFKNPTRKETMDVMNSSPFKSLRGVLSNDGNIYVWDSDFLHGGVISTANLPDGIHFELDSSGDFSMYITKGLYPEDIRDIFKKFMDKLNNMGVTSANSVFDIDTSYYSAYDSEQYKNTESIGDILKYEDECEVQTAARLKKRIVKTQKIFTKC